ncbi:MAG: hypothetical protein ABIM89_00885 [Mycobacteriales bacterium]
MRHRLALVAVGLAATLASAAGIGVRSTYGGAAAVDEPEYLLTALSLGEDRDLSIADELAEQRWRRFHDVQLPQQTQPRADGRAVSPHDPLLPLLIAVPMTLWGFVGAKLAIAALAGLLAALTVWTAVRRLAVPVGIAALVVGAFSVTAPLAVYGQQVYPELPAALVTLAAIAALLGTLRRRSIAVVVASVVALPWLSVKYVPVAAGLSGVLLWTLHRAGRSAAVRWAVAVLAIAGAGYLAAHRVLYGGWTVYASGDHFQESGEFGVVGFSPNYPGRGSRLVGLLVDRGFGIAAWQPAWLLLVPGVAAAIKSRPRWLLPVVVPLLLGYLNATYIALTMHGYWWPGRQLVVVLPLAVLLIAWAAANASRPVRVGGLILAALGLVNYAWLLVDGYARRITWVSRFEDVRSPAYRGLRPLLPDYRGLSPRVWAVHFAWIAVLVLMALVAWRRTPRVNARTTDVRTADVRTADVRSPDGRSPKDAGA